MLCTCRNNYTCKNSCKLFKVLVPTWLGDDVTRPAIGGVMAPFQTFFLHLVTVSSFYDLVLYRPSAFELYSYYIILKSFRHPVPASSDHVFLHSNNIAKSSWWLGGWWWNGKLRKVCMWYEYFWENTSHQTHNNGGYIGCDSLPIK